MGDGVQDEELELFVVVCVLAGASAGAGVPTIVPTELVVCVVGRSGSRESVGSSPTTPSTASWRAATASGFSAPPDASFHLRMRWCVPKTWRFAGAEKVVVCPWAAAAAAFSLSRSLSSLSPESS